jgi:hypothetical protein
MLLKPVDSGGFGRYILIDSGKGLFLLRRPQVVEVIRLAVSAQMANSLVLHQGIVCRLRFAWDHDVGDFGHGV